jgi:HAMP domain-containing protein
MPAGDLIVAAVWVGGLTLFLLGQAFAGWLKLRYARRSARHASRLSEATRTVSARRPKAPTTGSETPVPGIEDMKASPWPLP